MHACAERPLPIPDHGGRSCSDERHADPARATVFCRANGIGRSPITSTLLIAGTFIVWFPLAGSALAQSGVAAGSAATAPSSAAPTDASQSGTDVPHQNSVKPQNAPDVLDGLESLQLAKDPDFAPPIIEANELFQGRPKTGAFGSNRREDGDMKPLEANLDTPDLNPAAFQAGLGSAPPNIPNDRLPTLEIPNIFGPSMAGSPLEVLNAAGLSLQQRPLGTIGAPSFLSKKHSFPVGNSRVRFGVEVNAATVYNNNITGSSSNPQGDMIFTLQPTFYLETGKKGTMQFLWSPSFMDYAKYKQFNSLNQTFLFSSRYRWTKLRVGLDAGYLAQSGLFLNSQGQANQKAVYAQMFAGYSLTKKTEVSLNFSGGVTESSPGGRQFQGKLTAAVDYRVSHKTTIGAAVALGYSSWSAGMTTSESFLLRLLYNPTSKLVFKGEGGLQFRQTSSTSGSSTSGSSSSAVTTVMNLSLTYNPSSKTYVSMRLFRNVDMDAFSPGTQQIITGLESVVSWHFSHAASLQAALAAGRIENVVTNGQNSGTYNYVQANLALSYILSSDVNLSLFDNLQQRLGSTQGGNYMSNTSGMSMGLGF